MNRYYLPGSEALGETKLPGIFQRGLFSAKKSTDRPEQRYRIVTNADEALVHLSDGSIRRFEAPGVVKVDYRHSKWEYGGGPGIFNGVHFDKAFVHAWKIPQVRIDKEVFRDVAYLSVDGGELFPLPDDRRYPFGVYTDHSIFGDVIGDTIPSAGAVYEDPATVSAVQKALLGKGFKLPKYGADGKWGEETAAAIRAMQGKAGMPQTGVIDYGVLAALGVPAPSQGGARHEDVAAKAVWDVEAISRGEPIPVPQVPSVAFVPAKASVPSWKYVVGAAAIAALGVGTAMAVRS